MGAQENHLDVMANHQRQIDLARTAHGWKMDRLSGLRVLGFKEEFLCVLGAEVRLPEAAPRSQLHALQAADGRTLFFPVVVSKSYLNVLGWTRATLDRRHVLVCLYVFCPRCQSGRLPQNAVDYTFLLKDLNKWGKCCRETREEQGRATSELICWRPMK